jgi:hypothetical protein
MVLGGRIALARTRSACGAPTTLTNPRTHSAGHISTTAGLRRTHIQAFAARSRLL